MRKPSTPSADTSNPGQAEEYARAYNLFERLEVAELAVDRAKKLEPSTIAEHADMQAVRNEVTRLESSVKEIKSELQALNPNPLDGKPSPSAQPAVDLDLLATPSQLINAFGTVTGMDKSWFERPKDTPGLFKARRVEGVGQRGQTRPPLYCPMEVMTWLLTPKRKKGRQFHNPDTAWRMLKKHFPGVYAKNSAASPLVD
jgi:hypothetical protein